MSARKLPRASVLTHRTCSACSQVLELNTQNFYVVGAKTAHPYFDGRCKACRREYIYAHKRARALGIPPEEVEVPRAGQPPVTLDLRRMHPLHYIWNEGAPTPCRIQLTHTRPATSQTPSRR